MPRKDPTAPVKGAAKAARALARAQKEAEKKVKAAAKAKAEGKEVPVEDEPVEANAVVAALKEGKQPAVIDLLATISVSGVLTSRPDSRDVEISSFSIILHGKELIADTKLKLNYGNRYGLIGANGSGKSTLLQALAAREIPVPEHIDIWHLHTEAKPSDRTAMESVVDVVIAEQERLEKMEQELLESDGDTAEALADIYDRLDKLDPDTFESRAGELLFGLGFSQKMMGRCTRDMSGGWRMRVALAQALLVQPALLLLDEPTNHLDLGACVWLENYLAGYEKCLVVVSHSQDFMNTVCTHVMYLDPIAKLTNFGGNYDTFVQTKEEQDTNNIKKHKKEQEDIAHLLHFIRTCGTYSNLVKQAQSKQKIIDKMTEAGLTPMPVQEPKYEFDFPQCGKLPVPVLAFKMVSFAWTGKKEDYLYENLDFGVDLDSRIALVGPNGAGKSTLIKLMVEEIRPTEGEISRNQKLRIGYYNQHSEDVLDLMLSPIAFMQSLFPDGLDVNGTMKIMDVENWRSQLGRYGVRGPDQTNPMYTMSDGLKTRVVFSLMALRQPHMLLLDEPTNHLDMGCIDSLAEAINRFHGGLLLVSHDFRLISQVAKEVWVCDDKKVQAWKGDITSYKKHLAADGEKKAQQRRNGLLAASRNSNN
jgi:ATP-binding cassette subfamily F protein 2